MGWGRTVEGIYPSESYVLKGGLSLWWTRETWTLRVKSSGSIPTQFSWVAPPWGSKPFGTLRSEPFRETTVRDDEGVGEESRV